MSDQAAELRRMMAERNVDAPLYLRGREYEIARAAGLNVIEDKLLPEGEIISVDPPLSPETEADYRAKLARLHGHVAPVVDKAALWDAAKVELLTEIERERVPETLDNPLEYLDLADVDDETIDCAIEATKRAFIDGLRFVLNHMNQAETHAMLKGMALPPLDKAFDGVREQMGGKA